MNNATVFTEGELGDKGNEIAEQVNNYFVENGFKKIDAQETMRGGNSQITYRNNDVIIFLKNNKKPLIDPNLNYNDSYMWSTINLEINLYTHSSNKTDVSKYAEEISSISDLFHYKLYDSKKIVRET